MTLWKPPTWTDDTLRTFINKSPEQCVLLQYSLFTHHNKRTNAIFTLLRPVSGSCHLPMETHCVSCGGVFHKRDEDGRLVSALVLVHRVHLHRSGAAPPEHVSQSSHLLLVRRDHADVPRTHSHLHGTSHSTSISQPPGIARIQGMSNTKNITIKTNSAKLVCFRHAFHLENTFTDSNSYRHSQSILQYHFYKFRLHSFDR